MAKKITEHPTEKKQVLYGKETIYIDIPVKGAPEYIFRADRRTKDVISANGFAARHPQSIEDARASIIDIFCNNLNIMAQWVNGGADSMGNKWISTADEKGCMGYFTKGNIYVIKIPGLREVETYDKNVFEQEPNQKQTCRLYLNADTLKDATIIGVRPSEKSREIVFFTSIPAEYVIGLLYEDGSKFEEFGPKEK